MDDSGTISEKNRICPECGRLFHCDHSPQCWCSGFVLTPATVKQLRNKYNRCLCPDCLKKYASCDPEDTTR